MGIEEHTVESRSEKIRKAQDLIVTSRWATTYGDCRDPYLRKASDLYREVGMIGMAEWCLRNLVPVSVGEKL